MTKATASGLRNLSADEIRILEQNSCRCSDWSRVLITDGTDLDAIHFVRLDGDVSIGKMNAEKDIIEKCHIENCRIGDHATIRNIGDRLLNCTIGDNVTIINTSRIEFEPGTTCGVGTKVSVLDETGSRPVTIYPGMTAQVACLMAREPEWCEKHFLPILSDWLKEHPSANRIGDNVTISGCGTLLNVSVDREVSIQDARSLCNGNIINNAPEGHCMSHVGPGVCAEHFIIEDGVVDSSAILHNCYVGQGTVLEKGFSAHDSLFFANCKMENGEACALFAGPYTASMHKSSLLISCQTSFMNAGSGTNQSNHMYKLGPQYWGILERGVKTSSDSYLMFGAKIGAFSLLMGQHKSHPDSSQFPFSYLFSDARGYTVVVPALMLRSCGLMRDSRKWPARDIRKQHRLPEHDHIIFDVLNPLTVSKMHSAIGVIDKLLNTPNDDDDTVIRYRGMKLNRATLERGSLIYEWAIYKYLTMHVAEGFPQGYSGSVSREWVDIAGLLIRRDWLKKAMAAKSLPEMMDIFREAYERYPELEREWIAACFPDRWRKSPEIIAEYASRFDKMVEDDRTRVINDLKKQSEMLAL